jgi:hypothetical protein
MITITIEYKDNGIKLKIEGNGKNSDVIKEATYLIDHTTDIYCAVVDQLPPLAQLHVVLNALDTFKERTRKGEGDD